MRGLAEELGRLEDEGVGPLESIHESLEILGRRRGGVGGLPLRHAAGPPRLGRDGPAGRAPRRPRGPPGPAGSLVEFLAVRLLLDRFALAVHGPRRPGDHGPAERLLRRLARARIDPHWPPSVEQRAFLVFQLAQVLGLSPDVLYRLDQAEWATHPRGDRGVLRARAAADLPPGLRAAVPHPDARRHRAARPQAGRPAAGAAVPGRSAASTSARSRSAATWRSWPPTSRRSARPGSTASRCTTGARPTPTSSRSARS